uniref:D-aspartate oxidase-like n=1 Tax=Hirondellea gigas TaxID=1518452 RepID=A0A2P2I3D3_9CRUS
MGTRITIVGGGVSGLGCALAILNKLPDVQLTVISEHFSPDTTGDVAAGMWGPFIMGGTPPEDILRWSQVSWSKFLEWESSGEDWGVSRISGTCINTEVMTEELWSHIPIGYTTLTRDQCRQWGEQYVSGYSFTTLIAEPSKFLPKLAEEIKRRGATLRQHRLGSLPEASADADVVVNCSGVGAGVLVPDRAVIPIRGQVLRVRAPWVNTFLCDESEHSFAYILPNSESVVLGGTLEEGSWNVTEDVETSQRILSRCRSLMPSLKDAEVLHCRVGIRPGRAGGVRLEQDTITVNGRVVPVVHNYGHGGCGVTLMWGCAEQVAEIVASIVAARGHPPLAASL